ncbi:M23 family metallopeptidase [Haladaptatus caseinilyticus]|uniref:M23 family metallopeptidase n=1 Tax=Haladaptatus caseinilyticus TaxID=2993314 RepID=UPI00224A8346|nr:M23 family metallopeptidase [Haladaptatus caseinilyticus]
MGFWFTLGGLSHYLGGPWWLGFLCFLLAGILPIVLQTVSIEEDDTEYEITNRERAVYVLSVLSWSVTPWGVLTQILQLGGQLVAYARYRGGKPSPEIHTPETALNLPFDGEWTVVNGGITKDTSHSWEILSQRYAYDFVITDEDGNTHTDNGEELDDYYAFGKPIRAPADGTVVAVSDRRRDFPHPESARIEWRTWDIAGNHVTIEHEAGEFSFLAHLKAGSTTVSEDDSVTTGDVIGQCGNSGHSTEPHLHYQLQDTKNFWTAAGLVPRFIDVDIDRDDEKAVSYEPTHDSNEGVYLFASDRVGATK